MKRESYITGSTKVVPTQCQFGKGKCQSIQVILNSFLGNLILYHLTTLPFEWNISNVHQIFWVRASRGTYSNASKKGSDIVIHVVFQVVIEIESQVDMTFQQ